MIRQAVYLAFSLLLVAVFAGCAVAEPLTTASSDNDPADRPAARFLDKPDDPQPIVFPDDAAPHDRLTEWWYYTGHLRDSEGNEYGFQFVLFQAIRSDFPANYAAHFAIVDLSRENFRFEERFDPVTSPVEDGRPLEIAIFSEDRPPWSVQGGDGQDRIVASMPGYALDIQLTSTKPPVLHEEDGFFIFAPASPSYYYSRTRMDVSGTLMINERPVNVTGLGWMDHQWGDFLVLDNVGWDWFSIQMDNGEELMTWQSHNTEGNFFYSNASLVRNDGTVVDIPDEDIAIIANDQWISPVTGAVYPMGWTIVIDAHDIQLEVNPVLLNQEVIALETTGNVYWEGMVTAEGRWQGEAVSGKGYVELSGYAPAFQPELP